MCRLTLLRVEVGPQVSGCDSECTVRDSVTDWEMGEEKR